MRAPYHAPSSVTNTATAPSSLARGLAEILALFRSHPDDLSKSELALLSGLSRTTINQRLEPLLAAGLLVPSADDRRDRGRPPERFGIDAERGVVLVADMGASGLRVALCDMRARVLVERVESSDVTKGPAKVLSRVAELFDDMLADYGQGPSAVSGIGLDVPGPVDHERGRVVTPPIMTGWHDFDIPAFFQPRFDCPVAVEKDTNAMAFGEHRLVHSTVDDLVFVKIGTGIGSGLIVGGNIYRGADGAAGDVGHIQIKWDHPSPAPICRCGKLGCVEAYAGGWALQRDLRDAGVDVSSVGDVARLIRDGHPEATQLYRRASAIVGWAISDMVNVVNPRIVVLGGQLVGLDDLLFASVRETVYRRSLPLATRSLQIVPTSLGEKVGVHGLSRLVLDEVFGPIGIHRLLEKKSGAS